MANGILYREQTVKYTGTSNVLRGQMDRMRAKVDGQQDNVPNISNFFTFAIGLTGSVIIAELLEILEMGFTATSGYLEDVEDFYTELSEEIGRTAGVTGVKITYKMKGKFDARAKAYVWSPMVPTRTLIK